VAVKQFAWLGLLLAVIWAVQAVNVVLGYALNGWFGLIPRRIGGLDGIALMPFLHASFTHAASNTVPMIILGGLMAATAPRRTLPASVIIVVLGGLGTWIFGKTALHVGASGLIFGWFGFLVARGLVERRLVPLAAAIGVGFVYGSMVWGVLPGQPGVSWEAHLFGAIGGIAAAFLLRSERT